VCVSAQSIRLCQSSQNLVVSALGLVAGVEQQRVALRPPGVVVADTPDGNTNAVLLVDASFNDVGPVGRRSILDINLSHGAFGRGTTESSHGRDGVGALAGGQVGLRADAVNGNTRSDPFLDVLDHGLRLGVGCSVQASRVSGWQMVRTWRSSLVVVNVTLRARVGLLRSFKCDGYEVLAKHVVENTGAEATVLLCYIVSLMIEIDDFGLVPTEDFIKYVPCVHLSFEVCK
jgi:hypothetical protein